MEKNIVVVGAGVIGLTTAYYCAKAGLKVTVVDRGAETRGGCSFGNAGMIVPSHFTPLAAPGMVALGLRWMMNPESPFFVRPRLDPGLLSWAWKFIIAATRRRVAAAQPALRDLGLYSRGLYDELLADAPPEIGFAGHGLLMLCATAHALEEEDRLAARARELGIAAETLDPAALAKVETGAAVSVAGAVWYPRDAHLSPENLMRHLTAECCRMGVAFRWMAEVTGWDARANTLHALRLRDGDLPADEFILCGGIWSESLARPLNLRLPMQAGKGYSMTLATPRALPRVCSLLTEARVAVTPINGTLRIGGTMEMSGINHRIETRRLHGIQRAVSRYYPDLRQEDFNGLEPWHGLRPVPPDGMPYLGRPAAWKNLICSTGHAMMGLSLAPASGKITADLVSGSAPAVPLDLFSPDRY